MANGNEESTNKGQISVIVRSLASIALVCVIGDFLLIYAQKEIPTELWILTSNSITALTAMLVKTTPTATTPETKPPQTESQP